MEFSFFFKNNVACIECLRARLQGGRSSSSGRVDNFLSLHPFRPVLWPTQPRFQWVSQTVIRGVMQPHREADQSPKTGVWFLKT
jgi:hypothetical protein